MASETVADILREMREFADTDSQSIGRDVLRRKIHNFADRLNTKSPENVNSDGVIYNAAKLREAMKEIARITNTAKSDFDIFAGFERILKISNSALAEPPRNCDRFSTAADAWNAHNMYCDKYKHCHKGCPLYNEDHFSAFECFEAWLFAEAKGETK